jgi:hypothetical protein
MSGSRQPRAIRGWRSGLLLAYPDGAPRPGNTMHCGPVGVRQRCTGRHRPASAPQASTRSSTQRPFEPCGVVDEAQTRHVEQQGELLPQCRGRSRLESQQRGQLIEALYLRRPAGARAVAGPGLSLSRVERRGKPRLAPRCAELFRRRRGAARRAQRLAVETHRRHRLAAVRHVPARVEREAVPVRRALQYRHRDARPRLPRPVVVDANAARLTVVARRAGRRHHRRGPSPGLVRKVRRHQKGPPQPLRSCDFHAGLA